MIMIFFNCVRAKVRARVETRARVQSRARV